ncbi:DUF2336 domain-containing protein [Oleisolibacter albus]|uniref:DUF2336 domain-containing protein n=1 Tax=Oleisolibacter albus TaxID=2171757 RepID=UPI000DF25106|nr:DUF2336 domain-containing protein [Oleisolibacter albus]
MITPHDGALDYDTAKRLAVSADPGERRRVAGSAATRPELLYFLANDRSAEVRREIARNRATPRQADLLLVKDPDEEVRGSLAAKIAALAPTLAAAQLGQIERMTLEVLEALARDQATAVRQVVAETLKQQADAPPHIIQQLARDLELSVSGPVLRHSPLLTDQDLLEIIAGRPLDGQLVAIAERAGLSAAVCAAVASTESEAAVASLLGNESAQIREETLDRIIEMAPRHEPWHGPLVRRPHLPAGAAVRLAGFVAEQLVRVLESRPDLPLTVRSAVAEAVKARLPADPPDIGIETAADEASKERPMDRARRLQAEGTLDEDAVSAALTRGDRGLVLAALAVLSGYGLEDVDRVVAGQSPRGVTALCWKAGLSMRFCRQVQLRLATIPPTAVLNARNGTDYPMTETELKWQLEFFGLKA